MIRGSSLLAVAFAAACGSESSDQGLSTIDGGVGPVPTQQPVPTTTTTVPPPPPPPPHHVVRFIALGDQGTGEDGQQRIANAMAQKCKSDGCDFVQLLGDNLYYDGASSATDTQFQQKFEIPYVAIESDFFAILGNHDYGGDGLGNEFAKGQFQVDYTAKSKKWKMPAAYYHRVLEHVEFFALDTNLQFYGQDKAQRADVTKWVADSTTPWKVAIGHHPYASNGPHGNAGEYDGLFFAPPNGAGVKSFLEDIVCGKADIYISGHDHSQQWLDVGCKGTELVVSGAGSMTTTLIGANPTLFQSLALGFLYIVIDDNKLTAQFIDENGSVEFSHTKVK